MPFDSDLVFEALRRVAGDPARWDDMLDVLPADSETEDAPHPDLTPARVAEAARRERRPGEGAPVNGPPDLGWVALSARGQVLACNAPAQETLDGLAAIAEGSRIAWRSDANRAAADDGARRARIAGGQVIVRLERAEDEAPVFALASPLANLPWLAELHGTDPGAVCLVLPAADPAMKLWGAVRESFGLTEAEVRLARKLREGLSLQQAAKGLGVSVNTVRNQLRGVFEKVGVQRQSDLVRTLTELAGLNAALRPAVGGSAAEHDAPAVRRVQLADGRALAYREYGAAEGRPVVYMHEGMGSSLLPAGTDAIARDLNLRLIAPERPGYGQSDPRPDYGFDTVAADMVELCQILRLDRPILDGVVSGAEFALRTAALLPGGARCVVMVSARPPRRAKTGVNRFTDMRARMEAHPWLAESILTILRLRRSPALAQRMLHRTAEMSAGDQAFLQANAWVVDFVSAYVGESLGRSTHGPVHELRAFRRAGEPPAPDPGCPIEVWHGAEDAICPLEDVRAYLGPLIGELRVVENAGHFMAMKHWDALIRRVAVIAHEAE